MTDINKDKKIKILMVDDNIELNMALQYMLERYGDYSVITANGGHEGWEKFKKYRPDLVTTDVKMPGINGFELIELIKKESPETPVIVVSAFPDTEFKNKALELCACEYILKPVSREDLLNTIKKALNDSYLEAELSRYRSLSTVRGQIIKSLNENIKQLSKSKKLAIDNEEQTKYKAICGAVAHSLKGEFSHIGYSSREIRELSDNSTAIVEECDMIERSITYCQILLRRLLDYLDMGKPQEKPIDIFELLKKTELLVKPRLQSNIKLQIKVDPNIIKRSVSANFEQLMGILVELITNAATAMRNKGGTIEVRLRSTNNKMIISIRDDGPGIPDKLKKQLFKEQVDSKGGLGLGLYLCTKVIQEFGGELKLRSTSEHGTTFELHLPTIKNKKEQ